MIYVTSDIHVDYKRHTELIQKLQLTEKDSLIILGDVVDRGPDSMEILIDIMKRDNFFMYMDNHEKIALACLKVLKKKLPRRVYLILKQTQQKCL
ncbi:MAG: metallophosphoesterase [Lachnospirales bacterium]